MARSYDMRTRDRAARATHEKILAAAHELLDRADGGGLSLAEVANAAGVSRATIYNRFESRRGLLAAVFEDQGRRINYDRVLEAMEREDPVEAVKETVRESVRAWEVMPGALRRTLALAAVDGEVEQLIAKYERYRLAEVRRLVERVAEAGVLGKGVHVDQAASSLALHTSFQAYDYLRLDLDAERTAEHLVQMATASLGFPISRSDDGTPQPAPT